MEKGIQAFCRSAVKGHVDTSMTRVMRDVRLVQTMGGGWRALHPCLSTGL